VFRKKKKARTEAAEPTPLIKLDINRVGFTKILITQEKYIMISMISVITVILIGTIENF